MNWVLIVLVLIAGKEPEVVYQSEPITHSKCLEGIDIVKSTVTSDDDIKFVSYCLPLSGR